MKKQLFMFFAAALMTSGLVAQNLKFGALAGGNFNSISQSVDPEPDGYEYDGFNGFGFHLGAFGEYALSESLGLRAELQFQQRGLKDEFDETVEIFGVETTSKGESTSTDTFLAIPILASIKVGDTFSIHAGPSLGFLLGSKQTFESEVTIAGETTSTSGDDDSTEGRNGFELGLSIGGEYNLNQNMGIGFRYTRGLTDISDETEANGVTVKNNYNVVQLYFAYAFGG